MRTAIAQLVGRDVDTYAASQMTYDLRRLRLIERAPKSLRYRIADRGARIANLTSDPALGDVVAGLTASLVTELASISAPRVISHRSVLHLKGSSRTLPEIAWELGARGGTLGGLLRRGTRRVAAAATCSGPRDRHDRRLLTVCWLVIGGVRDHGAAGANGAGDHAGEGDDRKDERGFAAASRRTRSLTDPLSDAAPGTA